MSDRISIQCPECTGKLAVPSTAAGKKVRCPKCQSIVPVPGAAPTTRKDNSAASPPISDRAPKRSAKTTSEERNSAARPKKKKRPEPEADSWLNEDLSSNQGEDLWGDYGNDDGSSSQSLPPRSKAKRGESGRSALRGTGNEAPASESSSRSSGISFGPMITGVLMMLGAAIWFVVGLAGGVIFFKPPVLFVVGLISFFKGLFGSD